MEKKMAKNIGLLKTPMEKNGGCKDTFILKWGLMLVI
jgi:hypothetical protein